jgi:hypothetical protein
MRWIHLTQIVTRIRLRQDESGWKEFYKVMDERDAKEINLKVVTELDNEAPVHAE